MLAVKYNRAGALQRLLEAEVSRERLNAPSDPFRGVALLQPDLTLCDSDGYTALHFGAELHWIHGSPNLVKMLIAAGADKTARLPDSHPSNAGALPQDLAKKGRRPSITTVLALSVIDCR